MGTKLFNKEKARMEYVHELQTHIMDSLYRDSEKALEKAMWQVAEENQVLLKVDTPTFFFDGRWWPVPKPPNPKDCNRILHTNLYDRVEELLEATSFRDKSLRTGIKTMLGNFLSVAGHVEDLYRLLPNAIRVAIPTVDEEVFNINKPLPEHEIKDLLKVNEDNIRYLKRLLLTQALMIRAG